MLDKILFTLIAVALKRLRRFSRHMDGRYIESCEFSFQKNGKCKLDKIERKMLKHIRKRKSQLIWGNVIFRNYL